MRAWRKVMAAYRRVYDNFAAWWTQAQWVYTVCDLTICKDRMKLPKCWLQFEKKINLLCYLLQFSFLWVRPCKTRTTDCCRERQRCWRRYDGDSRCRRTADRSRLPRSERWRSVSKLRTNTAVVHSVISFCLFCSQSWSTKARIPALTGARKMWHKTVLTWQKCTK